MRKKNSCFTMTNDMLSVCQDSKHQRGGKKIKVEFFWI